MSIQRGFTLIELLVSITIGLILLGITANALTQITTAIKRDQAHRQAHDDLSAMHSLFDYSLESMHPGTQLRLEADPGADDTWGTGDERMTLIWMSALQHLKFPHMGVGRPALHDMVWNQLEWRGRDVVTESDGVGRGTLSYGRSSFERSASWPDYTGTNGYLYDDIEIQVVPQSRRDRRRDLNDNDLRFVPGITPTEYTSLGMLGDRDDLREFSKPIHSVSTHVATIFDGGSMATYPSFAWVDSGGYTVTADPVNGITIANSQGVDVTATYMPASGEDYATTTGPDFYQPSSPGSRTHIFVIDGTFFDGRRHIPVGDDNGDAIEDPNERLAMAWRPAFVRFGLPLITTSRTGLDLRQEPLTQFYVSIPTDAKLPVLP